MTRSRSPAWLVAAMVAMSSPLAAWAEADPPDPNFSARHSDKVMGTVVTVTLWTDDEVAAAKAAAEVFEEFRRIDKLMTTWNDDSDVSKINAAAGKAATKVSPEVFSVIERAVQVARQSGGAFDITIGAYRGLWKFDEDLDGTIPKPADVQARRKFVNYRWIELNKKKKTVRLKKKGMQITLGGIAKGYAVDRAVALLRERGHVDFILQAGGDLYAAGKRGSRSWRVGIRDPRGARDATFAVADIEDHTFSTSGDYERSLLKGGVRYHHILDPATGNPAVRSRSVTVMAKDALSADAWSTALFVMGHQKGMKLVEKLADFEAVFVDADNNVHISSGLKPRLRIQKKPTAGP